MQKTIFSYNVNGIRAALAKGFAEWLKNTSPDIICLQELKAMPEQVEVALFEHLGYHCYIHSAETKGYSGVAIFTRQKPDYVSKGMGVEKFDAEGRVIRADFGDITLISVYIPSGTTGDVRQDFKMSFLSGFRPYISELRKVRKKIIICGDYNICHKPIDINHPEKHKTSSGFLPEERKWFDDFIADGFVDTFRMFNNQAEQYSWWSYRAGSRGKNLGWRIDYHLATDNLKANINAATILKDIVHSDHCPVSVSIDI